MRIRIVRMDTLSFPVSSFLPVTIYEEYYAISQCNDNNKIIYIFFQLGSQLLSANNADLHMINQGKKHE